MKKIAKFEKISLSQWNKDIKKVKKNIENSEEIYNNIVLPKRATIGSAGYDFFLPFDVKLNPKESILIPTGIRVKIKEGYVFLIVPRSGLGFKYRLQLNNTIGVIDSDYYFSQNEGHIMCLICNDTNENKIFECQKNKGFVQGIFIEYGIVEDDIVYSKRNGGFGSTD